MEPKELSVSDEGKISILWMDGHKSIYSPFNLRNACPCAACKGEGGIFGKYYSPEKTTVVSDVQPEEIGQVGRYGLKIIWSDGHDLGIYTFDYLRTLCECEECKASSSEKKSDAG
jgi:DUF971 family protein